MATLRSQAFNFISLLDKGLSHGVKKRTWITLNISGNWVFATNSNVQILISLQPDNVNPWYFKIRIYDLTEIIV